MSGDQKPLGLAALIEAIAELVDGAGETSREAEHDITIGGKRGKAAYRVSVGTGLDRLAERARTQGQSGIRPFTVSRAMAERRDPARSRPSPVSPDPAPDEPAACDTAPDVAKADVFLDEGLVHVVVPLPGVPAASLKAHVDGGVLCVTCEGALVLSAALPLAVMPDTLRIALHNGIFSATLQAVPAGQEPS